MVAILPMPQFRAGQQGYNINPLSQGLGAIRQMKHTNAMLSQRDEQAAMQQARYENDQEIRAKQYADTKQHRNEMLSIQSQKLAQSSKLSPVDVARVGLIKSQTELARSRREDVGLKGASRNRRDFLNAYKTLNRASTPEQWKRMQPILAGIFGGNVPYDQRGRVLTQMGGYLQEVATPWGLDQNGALVGGQPAEGPLKAGDVPGIVTTPKGSSDRLATKFNEGNRAIAGATPEQQRRLMRHKQVQDMWTRANGGRPPKSGHVYAPNGTQVPSGALTVGAQNQASQKSMINNAIKNIDDSVNTMLGHTMLGRSTAANLDGYSVGRMVNSVTGGEKVAQAYRDYSQGVLAAVYAMSGKTTTNTEMERFLGMYMPQAGDSAERIKMKQSRIKQMLRAIQGSVSQGMSYDDAQRRAISAGSSSSRSDIKSRFGKYGVE